MQSADSDAAGLGWGLRFCICSQQPGGVDTLSRETSGQSEALWEAGPSVPGELYGSSALPRGESG